jgi:hypothetical protein
MATRIQVRRDSAANWTSNNPTLADGEIGFETDTGLFKIGTNNTSWTSLEYAQVSAQGYNLLNGTVTLFDSYSQEELSPIGTVPGLPYQLKVYTDVDNYAYTVGDTVKIKNFYDVEDINPNLSASATSVEALDSSIYNGNATFNLSEPISAYNGQYILATDPNNPGWVQLCEILTISGTEVSVSYMTLTLPESPTTSSEWIIQRDTNNNSPLPQYYDSNRNIVGNISGVGSNSYIIDILNAGTARWESNTCNVGLSGVRGLEGSSGPSGPTGDPGIPGTNGENGAPGDNGMPGDSAYDIWLNQGNSGTEEDFFNSLQGPGYEVTYDNNIHMLPDSVSYVWNGDTSWDVADWYTVPGDFSNSAYRVGDYVKYYFNDPSSPTSPYIEGWIRYIDSLGQYVQITIQRWSNNSDWSSTNGYQVSPVPIFPAHFEPGYNFDMRIDVANGNTWYSPTNLTYSNFTSNIQYGTSIDFNGYHRGSYNPGDYVVISSRSNPGIKVFAYIGTIGYQNFADAFKIYPLEILTWDASEEDTFNDWTLSIASPPKKEYKLSNPLPLPWDAADMPPSPFSAAAQFQRPEVTDVVSIFGDPGLFEVGNSVKAVSKSEPTAAFYGVITELGSASNNFVNSIEVTDISDWTDTPTNTYNDWQLFLGEKPVEYQLAAPEGRGTFQNTTITAEDIGKFIYTSNGDPITITLDVSPQSVPHGSQVTIVQRWNGSVTISPSATSGTIYFAETDGLTEGTVTLKGIYSAATLINAEGFWIVIGSFGSAAAYVGA